MHSGLFNFRTPAVLLVSLLAIAAFLPVHAADEAPAKEGSGTAITELNKKTLERKIELVESDQDIPKEEQAELILRKAERPGA